MRIIDRVYQYLEFHAISAYAFERSCDLSNGYLGKQFRGKGTMGSAVLLKIQDQYPDLNMHWLLTGKGRMIRHSMAGLALSQSTTPLLIEDAALPYGFDDDADAAMVQLLRQRIALLEKSLADKNELIHLLKKKRPLKRSASY